MKALTTIFSSFYFFTYCLKQTAHRLKNTFCWLLLFTLPYKSYIQLQSALRNDLCKLPMVQAVSLSHLSLGTVAVHGMAQSLFCHRHQNLYGRLRCRKNSMLRRACLPYRT